MAYLYLALAIAAEVVATSYLKLADGFSRLLPSLIVIAGYSVAFFCLSLVIRQLPLGITYAIWSGVGIVLITLVGWVAFQQRLDLPAIIGIGLIIAGVVVIQVFSKSVGH